MGIGYHTKPDLPPGSVSLVEPYSEDDDAELIRVSALYFSMNNKHFICDMGLVE